MTAALTARRALRLRGGARWAALAALLVLIGLGVHQAALSIYRDQAQIRLETRLALYAATLTGALDRPAHLPAVLAVDPAILGALSGRVDAANRRLADLAEMTGVEAIYLLDRTGLTVAASNHDQPGAFLGQNYGFRPYFRDALAGGRGEFYAIGATTSRPGYFVAGPVGEGPAGVLAVKLDLTALAEAWAGAGEAALVVNADGVVVLSSDPALRYRALAPIPPARRAEIDARRQFGTEALTPLDWRESAAGAVTLNGAPHLGAAREVGRLGWTLRVLAPAGEAERRALAALVIYAVALALGALALVCLRARRIGAALRLSQSERDALAGLNRRLEAEIAERAAAEGALRAAEADLARAERLAALGRLAAEVTHELGQPLSAMRNYLAAAEVTGEPADLPGRLAPVVARMEATTHALRAFARSGDEPLVPLDLRAVLRAAVDLTRHSLDSAGAEVEIDAPDAPVTTLGHPLRLEQALINLIRNAAQAVEGAETRKVRVTLTTAPSPRLIVDDSGPGLGGRDLAELAEPFHTTRAAGLGLGLALAQTIAQEHSGALSAGPSPLGGARFVIELREAP